jgi:hypothetical protein
MLCRCCKREACKLCDYAALDKDFRDDSDLPSESGSRLTGLSTEHERDLPTLIGDPPSHDLHVVFLFDLHYTLVHVLGDTTGQGWNLPADNLASTVHIRPFARELLNGMLQKQRAGTCRVGFYTPMAPVPASSAACKLLCQTTGQTWLKSNRTRSVLGRTVESNLIVSTDHDESVLILDETFCEHSTEWMHETSNKPYMMKSLIKVGHLFSSIHRPSIVYVTCSLGTMSDGKENVNHCENIQT